MHINVDEDGFVKKVQTTPGNVHDSQMLNDLLIGDESAVYADSAYQSQKHDALLKDKQIDNQIHQRAYRNKPLTAKQKINNTHKSQTRNTVERVFGHFKLYYGLDKSTPLGVNAISHQYIACQYGT